MLQRNDPQGTYINITTSKYVYKNFQIFTLEYYILTHNMASASIRQQIFLHLCFFGG